jgi:hypothetical protein
MDITEGLYREHLEELSILYGQYRWLRKSQRLKWHDVPESYARMEPHIDGLVLGNDAALTLCAERAVDGDIGECYGAIRVLIRQQVFETVTDLICGMDGTDDRRLESVRDAFRHERSGTGHDDVLKALLSFDAARAKTAARIIAFHRIDLSDALYDSLDHYAKDSSAMTDILHALGRLRPASGRDRLLDYLNADDAGIRNTAIQALVRMGDRHWVNTCKSMINADEWPPITLGLYGDTAALIRSSNNASAVTPEHVVAAGLTGDVSFVPKLIGWLGHPELAESAAQSLHMITGMSCFETVFVPDVIREEDLFENEREAWRNGTLYPDGTVPGETVTRLTRAPEIWLDGWERKRPMFDPEKRYRYGMKSTPSGLLQTLKSTETSDSLRGLAHEELVIRYGIDIPFETEMTAKQQILAVQICDRRLKGNPDGFEGGVLYYNGSPVDCDKPWAEGVSSVRC